MLGFERYAHGEDWAQYHYMDESCDAWCDVEFMPEWNEWLVTVQIDLYTCDNGARVYSCGHEVKESATDDCFINTAISNAMTRACVALNFNMPVSDPVW